ncbi:protein FAR1-RELATED SEQUENCE [Salix suchowensis]|nr:protein FAR1-RELATED SEQUENCE [Salix suchowensis]
MIDEPAIEAKDLVNSYVVTLEDEGDECCVVEDAERPMFLDVGNRVDTVNVELFQCLNGRVEEPALGTWFVSKDDARDLYNAYAKQTGFSIHVNSCYRSKKDNSISIRLNSYYRSKKDNSIISREFCFSTEGLHREKQAKKMDSGEETRRKRARPIMRFGCQALMTVGRRDNRKWYIAKLEKNHNHEIERGSVSSLFDGYVNARTTLQDFAEQYVNVLDDLYEKEAKAEFETFYTKPILKTPLPMEKQAAEVYTKNLFSLGGDGGTTTYEVAKLDEEQKIFQFVGIRCRHVIALFKATNVFILPQNYILQQLTKTAKDDAILDVLSCLDVPSISHRSRIKISGSKKNAISAQKLETVASNSFRDKNMISSHRDSHSLQTSHAGQKKANTAESCMYNNTFDYVWSNVVPKLKANVVYD